ncbi:VOC family protein [Salininema proteolyticum]|uniref:VOC family protein n=1 Tax=Salininema proteolyticum TaxID=1607685 RepID=A0ABV8TXE1_9ACTN
MDLSFNHTIVWAADRDATAEWWSDVFGVATKPFGPFLQIPCSNGVDLDICGIGSNPDRGRPAPQHYAFLVSEGDFDAVFTRVKDRGIPYWAHPDGSGKGEYNTNDGGRGVYFADPNGHDLEIITVPYGG